MVEDIRHWLRLVRPATKADNDWASSPEAARVLADVHRRIDSAPSTKRRAILRALAGRRVWLPVSAIACAAIVVTMASAGWITNPAKRSVPSANAPENIAIRPASMLLSNYSSCPDLLNGLRAHAAEHVGAFGFSGSSQVYLTALPSAGSAVGAPKASENQALDDKASTTNNHEVGVDEPDIVKTTATQIVTVTNGILRVIDRFTQKLTGSLDLTIYSGWQAAQLLLDDDHALVILGGQLDRRFLGGRATGSGLIPPGEAMPSGGSGGSGGSATLSTYLYVDLTGQPKVTGSLRASGAYLDARLIGTTVRLVVSSAPQIVFPMYKNGDAESKAANQAVVREAPLDAWSPQYTVTNGAQTDKFTVPCDQVSHPAEYTGASMLTVYTLDLNHLDVAPKPMSVAADGDTVYATKTSLYVTSNPNWYCCADAVQTKQDTEIHRFDISGSNPPTYLGSGQVPGRLLNQYSLSDYAGSLRIATTVGGFGGNFGGKQSSSVYVLDANALTVTGHVDGLGKGEQIYAVRFIGPMAYVVTFRQTDPLYVVDLTVASAPKLAGELHMTGVSGYLHDAGGGRLIGVGQEASTSGQLQGAQVSLFDVTKPASPIRTGQVALPGTQGEIGIDPHSFLYWQPTGLVAVPIQTWSSDESGKVLVLKVSGSTLTKIGLVANPGTGGSTDPGLGIQRSLVVDGTLWTVSASGVQVSDPSSLTRKAWIPFG